MKLLAHIFSTVFSPLLMPTYAIALAIYISVLVFIPDKIQITTIAVIFIVTCLLPMIFIWVLHRVKFIKDIGLNLQHERWLPYIFVMLCYAGAALYLINRKAPAWMPAFVWGALAAVIISFFVNFAWKISGHMAGIGGVVAMIFYMWSSHICIVNATPLLCASIIIAGCVGTSRIVLNRHTLGQVAAGFVNGFACVLIASVFMQ